MKLGEKFRLEIHWDKAIYEKENMCKLQDCYLSGPALAIAQQVQSNEYISLDFCGQYSIITHNAYVAKFSWGEVIYNANKTITLKDAAMSHDTDFHRVPKLNDNDYIIVDTQDHQVDIHHLNLVYKSYVINAENDLYNFRK
jgi:hypothetical protein